MTGLINKIYQKIIIKNPIITILFLIFILGFFSLYIKNFELDASADSLILEDDEDLKTFTLKSYILTNEMKCVSNNKGCIYILYPIEIFIKW